jgi:hypothetical protein
MRTNHFVLGRRESISLLILAVALQGCSSTVSPLDPADSPDVQPPSAPAPPTAPMPDLPEAPSGEVSPTGQLEVSVDGSQAALALGYAVAIYLDGQTAPRWVPGTGALTSVHGLPQGSHTVVLRPSRANCVAEDAGPHAFSIESDETTRLGFTVSCSAVSRFPTGTYERTRFSRFAMEFHGTLTETFVIEGDGSLRLRSESGNHGSLEYSGAYYLESSGLQQTRLVFVFGSHNSGLRATATLRGGCLDVDYNDLMSLEGFDDSDGGSVGFAGGEYCRP